jgi:hypothetical protein
LSYSDPKTAATWAETIGDERQRNSRLESIAQNWLRQDPVNAQNWLARTPLPDTTKQRLLRSIAND